jgi:hypothetical protein
LLLKIFFIFRLSRSSATSCTLIKGLHNLQCGVGLCLSEE